MTGIKQPTIAKIGLHILVKWRIGKLYIVGLHVTRTIKIITYLESLLVLISFLFFPFIKILIDNPIHASRKPNKTPKKDVMIAKISIAIPIAGIVIPGICFARIAKNEALSLKAWHASLWFIANVQERAKKKTMPARIKNEVFIILIAFFLASTLD